MRFGLHSGLVSASVLDGDRARFQLFGDTVNSATRMEHTGTPDRPYPRIGDHRKLFRNTGQYRWISEHKDAVAAKGNGVRKTFWGSEMSGSQSGDLSADDEGQNKQEIYWAPQILLSHGKSTEANNGDPKGLATTVPTFG